MLARTGEVLDTTAADGWVCGMGSHIGAAMPAALALGLRRLGNGYGTHPGRKVLGGSYRGGGSDQHELEILIERLQVGKLLPARAYDHLCLERRAQSTARRIALVLPILLD